MMEYLPRTARGQAFTPLGSEQARLPDDRRPLGPNQKPVAGESRRGLALPAMEEGVQHCQRGGP